MLGAATNGGAGQVLQLALSSLGLFTALAIALLVGIFLFRSRHRRGSRVRRIIDAGAIAIPGIIGLVIGLIGLVVGLAYLVILALYWLAYSLVEAIWASVSGGQVTDPAEFGPVAGQGLVYVGLGLLLAAAGALWLALVVVRAVRQAQRRLRGATYDAEPPVARRGIDAGNSGSKVSVASGPGTKPPRE